MKNTSLILICAFTVACSTHKQPNKVETVKSTTERAEVVNKFKPYKLIGDYTVIDTGEYSNGPMGGLYAIVRSPSNYIDTIDLGYGIRRIGDAFFYESLYGVKNYDDSPGSKHDLGLDFGEYYIIDGNKKITLSKIAPNFDKYFSSPNIIDNSLYYWQLDKSDTTGKIKVSATRFDYKSGKTQAVYLFEDYVETDDSGYFPAPYLQHDTIYFDNGKSQLKKFSKDFKSYN
ncbi:hypothetical protein [Mucilaginibacter agri]|uniref:Uncharacterized protein n=1 Tax=Mucilaginibacter agri TaxID=2695265 RepID=A0A965ZH48_9SPHI|nr:hypothetical protein [Mucilaginibacter agri]NCD69987.1 hypothetical protein [Mucilaginibacter agri]